MSARARTQNQFLFVVRCQHFGCTHRICGRSRFNHSVRIHPFCHNSRAQKERWKAAKCWCVYALRDEYGVQRKLQFFSRSSSTRWERSAAIIFACTTEPLLKQTGTQNNPMGKQVQVHARTKRVRFQQTRQTDNPMCDIIRNRNVSEKWKIKCDVLCNQIKVKLNRFALWSCLMSRMRSIERLCKYPFAADMNRTQSTDKKKKRFPCEIVRMDLISPEAAATAPTRTHAWCVQLQNLLRILFTIEQHVCECQPA